MTKDDAAIDVVFTFDTTGSMYPCLTQVRRYVKETTGKLFRDIPNLRVGIIAHGDYCDEGKTYVTKILDLTNDEARIFNFITNVDATYGGDAPECYELVLNKARTELGWKSGRTKILTMIGDDVPHHVGYQYNSHRNTIDWRNELGLLLEAGINVYSVHCMPGIRQHSANFYREIAAKTKGYYLTLDQFAAISDLIMGICYKQMSNIALDKFEEEIKSSGRETRNLRQSFRTLKGLEPLRDDEFYDYAHSKPGDTRLIPVPAGRFQVMYVDHDMAIREFIEEQGVTFNPGRGFYELTKSVNVQQYKEILLVDKKSGDIFNGPQVRVMLGLSPQILSHDGGLLRGVGAIEKLRPVWFEKYRVFIQSTSYNRKLIGGTHLMYEVSEHLPEDLDTRAASMSREVFTGKTPPPKKVSKKAKVSTAKPKKEAAPKKEATIAKGKRPVRSVPVGKLTHVETKISARSGDMHRFAIKVMDSEGNVWRCQKWASDGEFRKSKA